MNAQTAQRRPALFRGAAAPALGLLACALFAGGEALAATMPAPSASAPAAGLTPGADAPVDLHNGSFQHHIPIETPRFHDIAPSLDLAFLSAAGNGFAGVGWSLQGFSVIERESATSRGTRRCDASDTYTLDGEPLVSCTALGGTHCTRAQNDKRIVYDSSLDRWYVWEKNGIKATYGKIFQVPVSMPTVSCPYRYGLVSVEDPLGNKTTYNWFADLTEGDVHEELYPSSITYNGVTVRLNREARPDSISYGNGFDFTRQRYRLKSIVLTVDTAGAPQGGVAQLLAAYQLSYETSPTTGRSRLTAVARYGRDAVVDTAGVVTGGAVLTTQTFSYAGGTPGFTRSTTSSEFTDALGWTDPANYTTFKLADFDGDGKLDVCGRGDAGLVCQRWNGTAWETMPQRASFLSDSVGSGSDAQYYSTIQFPDLNGDGRADVCAHALSGLFCTVNQGGGPGTGVTLPSPKNGAGQDEFSNALGWSSEVYYSSIQYPDINGDGKADVCARNSAGVLCYLMNDAGTAFGTLVTGPRWSDANGWNLPQYRKTIQYPDINGDGRADICARTSAGIRCHLSTGTGFDTSITWLGPNWADSVGSASPQYYETIRFPDINGDGRADVCSRTLNGEQCYLALGAGRIPGQVAAYAFNTIAITDSGPSDAAGIGDVQYYSSMTFVDINGDGREDLCWRDAQGINCDRSNGTSFTRVLTAAPAWGTAAGTGTPPYYSTIRFGDLDGDGKADIFGRSLSGLVAYLTTGDGVERLAAVTNNGMGGSVRLTYAPSSTFPNTNAPPVESVVTKMEIDDGRGHVATTTYAYSGGQFDRASKRSLGFRYVKQTRPALAGEAAAPFEERWFMQTPYACVGAVDFTKKSTGAGLLLAYSQRTYESAGAAPGPFTCRLDQQSDFIYDASGNATCTAIDNTHCKRKDINYDYDAYGNVTVAYDYGDYFNADDDTTRETFYSPNAGVPYIVAAPTLNRLHAGIGTASLALEETRTYYDGASAIETPPVAGLPTMMQDWVSSTGGPSPATAFVTRRTGYDGYGNVAWQEDALGNRTSFTYDSVFHQFGVGLTNALGHSTTTTWDTVCGKPTTETDSNGQVTSFTQDAFCRQTRKDMPAGAFEAVSYSPLGNATVQWERVETPPVPGILGNVYGVRYLDGFGRTYRTQVRGPDPAVDDDVFVDTEWDARGNIRTRTLPRYQGAATATMTFDHDGLDRLIRSIQPDGAVASTSYNLWTVVVTDEVGKQVARISDAAGHVVSVGERDGASWNMTLYAYDPRGDLVRAIDPAGNVATYERNSLHQRLSQLDPDLGASSCTYDANGRLASETDARGHRTEMAYDRLGRIAVKRYGADTAQPDVVTYAYDEARAGAFNIGRPTSMTDAAGTATYDHDAGGRPIGETRSVGGVTHVFRRSFDAGDRLLGVRYPDGDTAGDDPVTPAAEVSLGYDAAGRLVSIPGLVNRVAYHAAGTIAQIDNANGTTTTRAASSTRNWLESIRTMRGTTRVQDVTYARDAEGKITAVTTPTVGEAWSYGYDSLGRLTHATRTSGGTDDQTFSYDKVGNILSNSRLGGYVYAPPGAARPHAMTAAGNAQYHYDVAGNMLDGAGRSYRWDTAGHLSRVTAGSDITNYTYDGDGVRIGKTFNGATTRYLGSDYEIAPDGTVTKYFRIAGNLVAKKVGARRLWLHGDQLDTIAVVTDESGAEVKRAVHRAYGESLAVVGTHVEPHSFTGETTDETGLIFLKARYYDPVIGRFLSPDTATPGDRAIAFNRYAYSSNDPVNYFDPTGHFGWKSMFSKAAWVTAAGIVAGVGCALAEPCGLVIGVLVVGTAVALEGVAYDVGNGKKITDKRMWDENMMEGAVAGLCYGLCFPEEILGEVALGAAWEPFAERELLDPRPLSAPVKGAQEVGRGSVGGKMANDAAHALNSMNPEEGPETVWVNPPYVTRSPSVSPPGPNTYVTRSPSVAPPRPTVQVPYVTRSPSVSPPRPAPRPVQAPYVTRSPSVSPPPPASPPPSVGGCFVAGTRVSMADGTSKAIEAIGEGDEVLAFDEESGQVLPALVTKLYVHEDWQDQASTVLVNGRLRATPNHPFFVNETWRRAEHMQVGDMLSRLVDFADPGLTTVPETIESLQPLPGVETVYNLEVDRYHTYFAEGLLVHNGRLKY